MRDDRLRAPLRLTPVDVGNVNLHHRAIDQFERIEHGIGSIAESSGIDDDTGKPLAVLLDPAHHFTFVIGLAEIDGIAAAFGLCTAQGFNVGQCVVPINLGLTFAE